MKNDQCNIIKISEMNKLIQEETKKIKGNAYINFSNFISELFLAVYSDLLKINNSARLRHDENPKTACSENCWWYAQKISAGAQSQKELDYHWY